jgi:hypothetical protein
MTTSFTSAQFDYMDTIGSACHTCNMADSFVKHYEMATGTPAAMGWDEYRAVVRNEWHQVLNAADTHEPEVHAFLERHPCMVPGYDAFHASLEPGPIYNCLFSKPVLPGIERRIPDFMWLPTDSETQWVVLVELEDPNKRWFTKDGQQTSELSQATAQVSDWLAHLLEPENMAMFRSMYHIRRRVELSCCLIYGRRADAEANKRAASFRRQLRPSGIIWMTYDRLVPLELARDVLCARVLRGEFVALTVPATLSMSPQLALAWKDIKGKDRAVLDSPHLSPERKAFLAERFAYWDNWANGNERYYDLRDQE